MSDTETVEAFAARARAWLADNMPRAEGSGSAFRGAGSDEEELAVVAEQRELQRTLYDGGFAGIAFPKEYGGLGLTPEYQFAFNREAAGYRMPSLINIPTFVPCAAVLLEFGTEEQKQKYIPPMLKGDALWMQFLSEPSGGSDVAGAQMSAVRDGDEWVLNGSKIWTTGAWWSDYGLCLARTNWDVPKHSGLSVFIVRINAPGMEVQRIEMINGSKEFCQEYLDDYRVPDSDRVGDVDDGWTVGRRWMFHERSAMGGGSPFISGSPPGHAAEESGHDPYLLLGAAGAGLDDPVVRDLVGEARALQRAGRALTSRVGEGMGAGVFNDTYAAVARLMSAVVSERTTSIRLELAGASAAAAAPGEPGHGVGMGFLMRQTSSIAGGTTEMARNNISERVLGMPRERTLDKDVPFRDVPKGPTNKS